MKVAHTVLMVSHDYRERTTLRMAQVWAGTAVQAWIRIPTTVVWELQMISEASMVLIEDAGVDEAELVAAVVFAAGDAEDVVGAAVLYAEA
jgi:hypothetical protein